MMRENKIKKYLEKGILRALGYLNLKIKFRESDCIYKKFSIPNRHVFFGYYDVSPFSFDDKLLLATHASTPLIYEMPGGNDIMEIGYYNLNDNNSDFHKIAETTSWCWQQGCRLQWYSSNNCNQIVYNRIVDGDYGCEILDIKEGKVIRQFKTPVYSVSSDGKWGLSLDFSRLQRLRPGYGYVNIPDETVCLPFPDKTGIWRLDMETGDKRLLFSVKDIANINPLESMKNTQHYFNHICFNPGGSRFMFFHLWDRNGKRASRLLTSDIEGGNIHILEDKRMVSHYTWKSNEELLVTGTHPQQGFQYRLYNDISGESQAVGEGILNGDGHPSYTSDGNFIVTDTYPDKFGNRNLLLFDTHKSRLIKMASFYSPMKFKGETRCDLHPRLSPSGKYISVDIINKKKRALAVIDIESIFC